MVCGLARGCIRKIAAAQHRCGSCMGERWRVDISAIGWIVENRARCRRNSSRCRLRAEPEPSGLSTAADPRPRRRRRDRHRSATVFPSPPVAVAHSLQLEIRQSEQPCVVAVGADVDVLGKSALELGRRRLDENLQRIELVFQAARLRQKTQIGGDVVAYKLGRAAGDARLRFVESCEPALAAGRRRVGDVHEDRLRLHGRELRRRQQTRALCADRSSYRNSRASARAADRDRAASAASRC